MARFIGLGLLIPLFGGNSFPRAPKVFLTLCLSYMVFININQTYPVEVPISYIVNNLLSNFLVGIIIGIVMMLVLYSLQFAGEFIGFQMGFAMANIFNPDLEEEISIVSQLSYFFGIFIFFIFKGHIFMYTLLIESFEKVPVVFSFDSNIFMIVSIKLAEVFVIGFQFAMPLVAIMIFIKLSLGIISRLIPQMNVFMVGLPLQVGVGFLIFMVVVLTWKDEFLKAFFEIYSWVKNFIPMISK